MKNPFFHVFLTYFHLFSLISGFYKLCYLTYISRQRGIRPCLAGGKNKLMDMFLMHLIRANAHQTYVIVPGLGGWMRGWPVALSNANFIRITYSQEMYESHQIH